MISLPYDFARCGAERCEVRERCLRYTAPARPDGPQTFIAPATTGPRCQSWIKDTDA